MNEIHCPKCNSTNCKYYWSTESYYEYFVNGGLIITCLKCKHDWIEKIRDDKK